MHILHFQISDVGCLSIRILDWGWYFDATWEVVECETQPEAQRHDLLGCHTFQVIGEHCEVSRCRHSLSWLCRYHEPVKASVFTRNRVVNNTAWLWVLDSAALLWNQLGLDLLVHHDEAHLGILGLWFRSKRLLNLAQLILHDHLLGRVTHSIP